MLQWMGGSRRKLNASRKSVQSRQKQYFDQRKRQQPSVLDFYDQERKRFSQDTECRSLDVLTLKHIVESFDGYNTDAATAVAFGNKKLDDIPSSSIPSEFVGATTFSPLKTNKWIYGTGPKQMHHKEIASRRNVENFSEVQSSAITTNQQGVRKQRSDQLGNQGNLLYTSPVENLSVLELVGDEGSYGTNGRSIKEEHVAFSVEGLGKVGVQTPVHSPNESSRVFYDGGIPLCMDREIIGSRKKLKYVVNDCFYLEKDKLDSFEDFFSRTVSGSSKIERNKNLPTSSDVDSVDDFQSLFRQTVTESSKVVKCKYLAKSTDVTGILENSYGLPCDEVLTKTEKFCGKHSNKGIRSGSHGFQSDKLFDEDALWGSEPFKREICDYDFEDTFVASSRNRDSNKKNDGAAGFLSDTWQLNFPQHFQRKASEGINFPTRGKSCLASEVPNKKVEIKNQYSNMAFSAENDGETLNLSDESSSTTVKGITMIRPGRELKHLKPKRKSHARAYHCEMDSVWSKDSSDINETSKIRTKHLFQDKVDSLDLELSASRVHTNSLHEDQLDFVDWDIDDCLGKSSSLGTDLKFSSLTPKRRGTISVDHNSSASSGQFFEKHPSEETSELLFGEEDHPDVSSGMDFEGKKECVAETNSEKLEEEVLMGQPDPSIEYGKDVDSCSEHDQGAKERNKDLVLLTGMSKSLVNSGEVVENFKKPSENLEIGVENTTSDVAGALVPSQICRTGNNIRWRTNKSNDPSYQVLLESRVLQLVCVQKVQLEALTPRSV